MVVEILRIGFGLVELCAPGPLYRRLTGSEPDRTARVVIRVLGARHVVQGLVLLRAGRTAHRLGAGVDLLHGLSMVGLAAVDERRRAGAHASAIAAFTWSLAELVAR